MSVSPKPPSKRCKDCPGSSKRPVNHPGPRCTTHHRAFTKAQKARRHEQYVQKTYSLEAGVYQTLYSYQGGTCAVCRRATGKSKKLSVDHDHACCDGPVSCGKCCRGLLCGICNKMLGAARDSVDFFQRAIDYLEHPPYQEMRRNGDD